MSVCVLDDDPSVCRSLERILRSAHHDVRSYTSPQQFLASRREDADCLILDLNLPERSGLEMQQDLANSGIPIVFITGQADIPSAVRAMKAGAVDFLAKPFDAAALLEAVARGLEQRRDHAEDEALRQACATLTPRERDVFVRVVSGMLNKQIGYELRISEKTVKVHRARVVEKLGARSLPDLVRLADRLGLDTVEGDSNRQKANGA